MKAGMQGCSGSADQFSVVRERPSEDLVKGGQSASTTFGECCKVGIGHLSMTHDVAERYRFVGERVIPEFTSRRAVEGGQDCDRSALTVTCTYEEPDECPFDDGAESYCIDSSRPSGRLSVVLVIGDNQGNEGVCV